MSKTSVLPVMDETPLAIEEKKEAVKSPPTASASFAPNGEERDYVDRWARHRLSRSRGKKELLMVYVKNEENRGHNHDYPSVFEQGFTDFCNLRV